MALCIFKIIRISMYLLDFFRFCIVRLVSRSLIVREDLRDERVSLKEEERDKRKKVLAHIINIGTTNRTILPLLLLFHRTLV